MSRRHAPLIFTLVCCALFALAGCTDHSTRHDGEEGHAAVTPVEAGSELEAVLMRADAVDGSEDRVVSRCPGCALAMGGKADHALHVGEFAVHFCSDRCEERFADDPAQSLLAMEFSEETTGAAVDETDETATN